MTSAILVAVLACVLLLPAACTSPTRQAPQGEGPRTASIYVVDRGWHTDIGLPADEITGPVAALESGFPGVRTLTLGFGEREFLTSHRVTIGSTLRALFPSRSAMLVTALRAPPDAAFGTNNVVTLWITADGLAQLKDALWRGVERKQDGEPVSLGPGPYAGSEFYAALGTYDALNTCNTWTANMLRAAGLPVSPVGIMFSGQVMDQARAMARHQESVRLGNR